MGKAKAGNEAVEFERRKPRKRQKLDEKGREILDSTPMQPPLGYKKQESLHEQIKRMVVSEQLRLAAEQSGKETFEEADDFDVEDDYDPSSPFEEIFEGVGIPAGDPLENTLRKVMDEYTTKDPAAPAGPQQPAEPAAEATPPPQVAPERRGFFEKPST